MSYLTEKEYLDLGFTEIVDPFTFDSLLKKATTKLDSLTRYYYHSHDIETDNETRVHQFKMALGAQIDYSQATRVTSSADVVNRPKSVSMGRTSVSYGGSSGSAASGDLIPTLNPDVYTILSGTGLLHRGGYYV